jgi:heme/copper-type cytochrome/quinol oxidase subunit 2
VFVFLIFIVDGIRLHFAERLDPYLIFKKEAYDLGMLFLLMLIGIAIAIILVFIYVVIIKKVKGKDNNAHTTKKEK